MAIIENMILARLSAMEINNYSDKYISCTRKNLGKFKRFCAEREIATAEEITPAILERYKRHIHTAKTAQDRRYSATYQHQLLSAVYNCFAWAFKRGDLLLNPAVNMDLPRVGDPLPKKVLTANEMETLLSQPDIEKATGLRDRAILEVFYATAIRVDELSRLSINDVDPERRSLWVRLGKGRKDRVVPLTERVLDWLDRYQLEARPQFLEKSLEADSEILFLSSKTGKKMHYQTY